MADSCHLQPFFLVKGPFETRKSEVFYRDMQRSVAVRASRNSEGSPANADSGDSSMSGDGRVVVFSSEATNLVSEPIQARTIFLHDRRASPTLAPMSINFGSVSVGSVTAEKLVTVTNAGPTPIQFGDIALVGSSPTQFRMASNCSGTLAGGAECVFAVRFRPGIVGAKSATLTVTPASGTVKSATLTGTGT
jgi:hypothetical protein